MKLVCISDTHNKHNELEVPEGDVLIHAGDFSEAGTEREIRAFFKWFSALPHRHKICVAGNHDFYLDGITVAQLNNMIPDNVHYLMESGLYIEQWYFWGAPFSEVSTHWAFPEKKQENRPMWGNIPAKTDVLITHSPPYDIMDEASRGDTLGSRQLRKKVAEINPKFHIFGHLHDNYGIVHTNATTFVNATSFNSGTALVNPPITLILK